MISFIKSIFYDLSNRVDKLCTALYPKFTKPKIDTDFLIETNRLLQLLGEEIKEKIDSGELDVDIDDFRTSNIIAFNLFYDRITEIEVFRHSVIMSYNEPEIYFNNKISRIYIEINNLHQKKPLVTTTSNPNSYYWTMSAHNIIALPAGEEKSLLNLPDLYHEIGHMIYVQHGDVLRSSAIDAAVKAYYAEIEGTLNIVPKHREYIKILKEKKNFWLGGHWIMEFCCDFIAAYLVGPAYAWTNFKLSTQGKPAELYKHEVSHPCDEARMRGILIMLRAIDHSQEEVDYIKRCWNDFLNAVNRVGPPPPGYDSECPDELLRMLADNVLKQCRQIGLRDYNNQILKYGEYKTISHILNLAWKNVRSSPKEYKTWEQQQIAKIEKMVAPTEG